MKNWIEKIRNDIKAVNFTDKIVLDQTNGNGRFMYSDPSYWNQGLMMNLIKQVYPFYLLSSFFLLTPCLLANFYVLPVCQ